MAAGTIREVEPGDLPALTRIVRECGFPERSEAGWHWVLFENPDQADIPPGWVCVRDGAVVGFLGNFAMRYRIGERVLRAAVAHTMVTDLGGAGRQAGLALVRHGTRQTGIDVYSTLNNNGLSARILPRIGVVPWLGEAGRTWLEWPTAPGRILATRLHKALIRRPSGDERFARDFRTGFDRTVKLATGVTLTPLADVSDADLDALMTRLADEGGAVRVFDRVRLDYRRADPDRTGGLDYMVASRDGAPVLLAATLLTKPAADGLEHLEIADWVGLDDAAGQQAQAVVLRHILCSARRAGLAKVRLHFPDAVPDAVTGRAGWALRRRLDYDPCHVQFRDPAMRTAWTPRPGDADYFFAYRTPPGLMRPPA